jgi:exoribonuclease II
LKKRQTASRQRCRTKVWRRDLTALDFVTIDSASTEDMDDALFAEER